MSFRETPCFNISTPMAVILNRTRETRAGFTLTWPLSPIADIAGIYSTGPLSYVLCIHRTLQHRSPSAMCYVYIGLYSTGPPQLCATYTSDFTAPVPLSYVLCIHRSLSAMCYVYTGPPQLCATYTSDFTAPVPLSYVLLIHRTHPSNTCL